jgi:hypothetical protein
VARAAAPSRLGASVVPQDVHGRGRCAELPLYEAYAPIWASDNLQYNGGGAAHSSAYNIFAFRCAAKLRGAGRGRPAYEAEAELIHQAMQQLFWVPDQGAFAESKDLYGPQTVYNNPALWTVYHTIDSEVPSARQAWQMAAERLAVIATCPSTAKACRPADGTCWRARTGCRICGR